mmetsp:Transcript_22989/g.19951  ORF Transcript_22989/g.19951 Transcript_22989/m.19951 type:complete len:179 (-) Transcript_22989:415-951(-)
MKKLEQDMSDEQIEKMMDTLKVDKETKFLQYSEFLSAAMSKKSYTNEQRLWDAFKHFDVDNSGYITAADIKQAMTRAGRKVPEPEIEKMIREFDHDLTGKISFENFRKIMIAEDNEYEIKFYEDKAIRSDRSYSTIPSGILTPLSNRSRSPSSNEIDQSAEKKKIVPKKTFGDYLTVY